jgi:hypothetical protein
MPAPIPAHLAAYPWYAPHQAWLAACGCTPRHESTAVAMHAYLAGADLRGADLRGADLRDADLTRADLRDADLRDADLTHAYLAGADLRGANLRDVREDIEAVLALAPDEAPAVLAALEAGRVDGSVYEGECSCLVGTIARARGVEYRDLGALRPDASRPAERWFFAIRQGDTPATSPIVAWTADVVREWIAAHDARPVRA